MTLDRTQKGTTLLSEIKKHNDIDNLIFRGYYSPGFSEPSFGFFNQVLHQSGKPLVYPESNTPIDGLFTNSTGLIPGQEYLFEAEIAIPKERKKRQNPYLLKAKDFSARELVKVIENQ